MVFFVRISILEPNKELHWKVQVIQSLWLLLKPCIGSMSLWLTRNFDRSSYESWSRLVRNVMSRLYGILLKLATRLCTRSLVLLEPRAHEVPALQSRSHKVETGPSSKLKPKKEGTVGAPRIFNLMVPCP